jgi:hypothetical protein
MANRLTIGLFGTCGGSAWREDFKDAYAVRGYDYYDPQKADWQPEDAILEAEHLANDAIILFPITNETYGSGSLCEVGFSILHASRADYCRDFVIMVDPDLKDTLKTYNGEALAKESIRSRALVIQHLKRLRLDNVYVVDTLEEMLLVSIQLYEAAKLRNPLSKYNPHG